MTIIRGSCAVFDRPSGIGELGDRNVFRKGCFDHIDLADPAIKSMIGHEREFEADLKLWLDHSGLQFEIRPGDSSRAKLVVSGIRSGHFRGSSIGCTHSGARAVTIGGSRCTEVLRVERIEDVSICREGASTFAGCYLVDQSQRPRDVLPFRSRQTEEPNRSRDRGRGQTLSDAKAWHKQMIASELASMGARMDGLAAERLNYDPGKRGIY